MLLSICLSTFVPRNMLPELYLRIGYVHRSAYLTAMLYTQNRLYIYIHGITFCMQGHFILQIFC